MTSPDQNELTLRQRGDRADRVVAVGVFIAFLATGFFGDEPREPGPGARAAEHRASVAAARR
jgi:hypothetical protein